MHVTEYYSATYPHRCVAHFFISASGTSGVTWTVPLIGILQKYIRSIIECHGGACAQSLLSPIHW